MTVAGTYQFQYSVLGCLDTVSVTVEPCAVCVKPNAGPDAAAVCQPIATAKLTAVTVGGTWAVAMGWHTAAASGPAFGFTQTAHGSTVTDTVSKQPKTLYWNW